MLGPTKSRLQIFVQHVLHQKESSTGISCQTDVKLLRHAVLKAGQTTLSVSKTCICIAFQ